MQDVDNRRKIEEANEKCQECMKDFEKEQIPFDYNMCSYCKNGAELHRLLKSTYEGEKAWDKLDWNSSKWESLYHA